MRPTPAYTGNIIVSQGELQDRVTAANSLGTGTVNVTNGADLATGGAGTITIANAITLNGTGNGNGALQANDGTAGVYSGPITLAATSNIGSTTGAGASLTISGAISGAGRGGSDEGERHHGHPDRREHLHRHDHHQRRDAATGQWGGHDRQPVHHQRHHRQRQLRHQPIRHRRSGNCLQRLPPSPAPAGSPRPHGGTTVLNAANTYDGGTTISGPGRCNWATAPPP